VKFILVDRKPVEVNTQEWLSALTGTNWIVAREFVSPGIEVSTIFTGLGHDTIAGPPKLFETMIIGGPNDLDTRRYATWEEAEIGHREVVEQQRAVAA
jgi:hypothetical protein